MTEQQILIFLAFLVCTTIIICVATICRTWRIVTLIKVIGLPKEAGEGEYE